MSEIILSHQLSDNYFPSISLALSIALSSSTSMFFSFTRMPNHSGLYFNCYQPWVAVIIVQQLFIPFTFPVGLCIIFVDYEDEAILPMEF